MSFTAVPYVELVDGNSEGADDQGAAATKNYGVSWANRLQFVRDVMGYSSVAGGVGSAWNRKYPLAYPDDPHLFARSVEVTPQGAYHATTPLTWDNAIVTVHFRAPNWSFSTADDPLFLNSFSQDSEENNALTNCTQSLDIGYETHPMPQGLAVYADGTKPTQSDSVNVTVLTMTLTWTDLPYMPIGKVLTCADAVNNDTFLGRPRGTVMLVGPHTNRKRMADGTVVQDFTLQLKTRVRDWNEKIMPDGSWDYVYYGMSGALPDTTKTKYPYKDFKPLLFIGSSS